MPDDVLVARDNVSKAALAPSEPSLDEFERRLRLLKPDTTFSTQPTRLKFDGASGRSQTAEANDLLRQLVDEVRVEERSTSTAVRSNAHNDDNAVDDNDNDGADDLVKRLLKEAKRKKSSESTDADALLREAKALIGVRAPTEQDRAKYFAKQVRL